MTHEPIRVIHFTPHITWQGTQAELDDMLAEGWFDGSKVITNYNEDLKRAEAYAAELEAKLAEAQAVIRKIVDPKGYDDDPWGMAMEYVASLQGGKT